MDDGKVKLIIDAEDAGAQKTLEKVEDAAEETGKKLEEMGDSAKEAGKGFGAMDVAAGELLANGVSNLIAGLKNTAAELIALAESTREYREDMAKLSTAFTTAGHSSETANEAYKSFYKILGESDRSVEAANHLAELTNNEKEVAQWSTIAAGVTAKFGDSLPLEGLTEAANETAKVGQTTGVLADALNWASKDSTVFSDVLGGNQKALNAFNYALKTGENVEDAFTAALGKMSSEQERSSAITGILNGLYSDAAAEYNELTKSTQDARAATAEMEEAQAAIGATIEPLTTAWTNLKAQAFEAMQPVIESIVNAFQSVSQWMEENPEKAEVIKGVVLALAAAFGVLAIALGIGGIIQIVTTAMASLGAVMAIVTSPITLIIAGIAALVAGFLYLWNNCDAFREFWINLWEKIKEIVAPVWEDIQEIFRLAWEHIKAVWDYVKPYFMAIWEGIKTVFMVVKEVLGGYFFAAWEAIKLVWSAVSGYFKQVWETIKGIFSVVKSVLSGNFSEAWEKIKAILAGWGDYFKGLFNKIVEAFSNIGNKFKEIGKNIVDGVKNGISNAWDNLKEWFSRLFDDLIGIAKKILGIHSPSKEFAWIGAMTMAGLIEGAEDNRKDAIDTFASITNDAISAVEKEIESGEKRIEKELERLDDIRNKHNANAVDAQKKALNKEKKALQERKQAFSEFARNHEKQLSEMAKLEDDYAKNMVKVQETLTKDIENEWKNFIDTRENRARAIENSLGLFDEVEKKEAADGRTMTRNLAAQVKELERYNKALDTLSSRIDVTGGEFLEEILALGVDNLPELEALNRMSDDELSHYAELWAEKGRQANLASATSLEQELGYTEYKISQLIENAEKEADTLTVGYQTAMLNLMGEVRDGMINTSEAGIKALGAQLGEYVKSGEALMDGVTEGVLGRQSAVVDAVVENVLAAIRAAKKAAGIHSPSKVMEKEVGDNLALGLEKGWTHRMNEVRAALAGGMSDLMLRLKSTVNAENARYGYTPGVADNGMGELTRAVGAQTASINSLGAQSRAGSGSSTVVLELNGRELGRAVVETGTSETVRTGVSISGGAR